MRATAESMNFTHAHGCTRTSCVRWMHELKRNFEWHELIKLCYMRLCAFAVTHTHTSHTFCCNSTLISTIINKPHCWAYMHCTHSSCECWILLCDASHVPPQVLPEATEWKKNQTKTEILFQEFTRIVYKYIYAPCVRVCVYVYVCSVYIVNTTGAFPFFRLFFVFPPLPSSIRFLFLSYSHTRACHLSHLLLHGIFFTQFEIFISSGYMWILLTHSHRMNRMLHSAHWIHCLFLCVLFFPFCLFGCHLWMWCKLFCVFVIPNQQKNNKEFGFLVSSTSDLQFFSRLQKQTMKLHRIV